MRYTNNKKQTYKFIFKRRKQLALNNFIPGFTLNFHYSIIVSKPVILYGCHIRSLVNHFTKFFTRKTKLTKKMRFRKKSDSEATSGIKNILMYKNANQLYLYSKKKKILIKSYFFKRKIKNYGIFITLPKLPLSKKPLNMRMGKGKGVVKKWFICLKPNKIFLKLLYVKYWKNTIILKKLLHILPKSFTYSFLASSPFFRSKSLFKQFRYQWLILIIKIIYLEKQ